MNIFCVRRISTKLGVGLLNMKNKLSSKYRTQTLNLFRGFTSLHPGKKSFKKTVEQDSQIHANIF